MCTRPLQQEGAGRGRAAVRFTSAAGNGRSPTAQGHPRQGDLTDPVAAIGGVDLSNRGSGPSTRRQSSPRRGPEKGRGGARRDRCHRGRRPADRAEIRRPARYPQGVAGSDLAACRRALRRVGLRLVVVAVGGRGRRWQTWAGPATLLPPSAVLATLGDLAAPRVRGHVEITLLRVLSGFAISGGDRARRVDRVFVVAPRSRPDAAGPAGDPLDRLGPAAHPVARHLRGCKGNMIALGVFPGLPEPDGRAFRMSTGGWSRSARLPLPHSRRSAASWHGDTASYFTGLRGGLGLAGCLSSPPMGASEGLGFLLVDGQQEPDAGTDDDPVRLARQADRPGPGDAGAAGIGLVWEY